MRASGAAGAIVILLCAWWAFAALAPLDPAPPAVELAGASSQPAATGINRIDRNAFCARLWNPPPGERRLEPSQRSVAKDQPPIRFQLVGIIREDGQLKAALYDPSTDRLLIVVSGDQIGRHTVSEIDEGGVELSDGRTSRRLALREDRS